MTITNESSWRFTAYGLLFDQAGTAVFLRQQDDVFMVPSVEGKGALWESTAARMQPEFQKLFGQELNVLYRADCTEDPENERTESHFVLESPAPSPLEGTWIDREQLDSIELYHPKHRTIINSHLAEIESHQIPAKRSPWARRGWHQRAAIWIEEQLRSAGLEMQGTLEPVKNWSLSNLLRARTNRGDFYFKTSLDLPLFVNEARVVSELGRIFPEHVPSLIAARYDHNWMLMADSGQLVDWGAPLQQRMGFIDQFGQLQRESINFTGKLIKIGCLDRSLTWLELQIDYLLNSPETPNSLTESEFERLLELSPELKSLCGQLAAFKIPNTLVHGDLHGGNVSIKDGTYIFFDWTDASISHPFFDMLDIYSEEDAVVRDRLEKVVLSGWQDYESPEKLREAWTIGRVLAALNQAISYHEILINTEPNGLLELEWGLPYWLRKMLHFYDHLRIENE